MCVVLFHDSQYSHAFYCINVLTSDIFDSFRTLGTGTYFTISVLAAGCMLYCLRTISTITYLTVSLQ